MSIQSADFGLSSSSADEAQASDLGRMASAVNDDRSTPPVLGGELAQDPQLLADFLLEAREHLVNVEEQALILEQDPATVDAVHSAFRSFHSLKGLAGFLEFNVIQEVSHEVETILVSVRNGEMSISRPVIDAVLAAGDYLNVWLKYIEDAKVDPFTAAPPDHSALLVQVRNVGQGVEETPPPAAPVAPPAPAVPSAAAAVTPEVVTPEPVTPAVVTPEVVTPTVVTPAAAPPPTAPPATPPTAKAPKASVPEAPAPAQSAPAGNPEPPPAPEATVQRSSQPAQGGSTTEAATVVKVDTAKLEYLVEMVGELVIAEAIVRHDPGLEGVKGQRLQRNLAQMARVTSEVQKTAMAMRMLPIGQLFRRMNRLVRDLTLKSGKLADLETSGDDVELDRTIVDLLADPLIHMLRNSVDHGLETPDVREAAGKPRVGKVMLKALHQAGQIVIEVSDDGRGLNRDRIRAKAVERHLVSPDAALSDAEIFNLIFEPGFSTAEQVTDISGRGVGMDVVRRHLEKLRGRIDVVSTPGKGTQFILKLPLTLAIIDGLVVMVGEYRYIVPLFAVREMFRPAPETIFSVEQKGEMALVRGRLLPIVRLYRQLGVKPRSENPSEGLLIVGETEGKSYCLLVDALLGKQEVVIKNLGDVFRKVEGVAGGAILGDGRVGLILDMDALCRRSHHVGGH